MRALFLLVLPIVLLLGGCAFPEREKSKPPAPSFSFGLASANPAHLDAELDVQGFVIMKQPAWCDDDGECSPEWIFPVSFAIESASCENGSCAVERISNWSESTGIKITVTPRAPIATLRVVIQGGAIEGGAEDTIVLRASP